MPEELGKEILVESAKEVAKEVYGDALKPAVKSVGNIIALPFQAIDAALSKPKLWVAEKQYNYERTRELLAEKLKNVPEEDIVPPENYVAIPALQQISYCFDSDELRDMYANLLASSMKKDKKWSVHPAFVDIIKQLTPDEAKLLKAFVAKTSVNYPIIDIHMHMSKKTDGYIVLLSNYTNIAESVCDCPENISAYLDNLSRLEIISIDKISSLTDKSEYKRLENTDYAKIFVDYASSQNNEITYNEGIFHLTSFGVSFIKACIQGV